MLNADSRTLKKPSAPQMSPMPPMIRDRRRLVLDLVTTLEESSTELSGNARRSSSTR